MMIKRALQDKIIRSLKDFPVIGMLGSRQVGKTTLAKTIKNDIEPDAVYLDLELPSDFNKLQDAEMYLKQCENKLVIIDEVQRMPSLFPLIRALVDQKRTGSRFFLLGSASPALIRHSLESLAGRIIYHELAPLSFLETGADSFENLLVRGGYPRSYLAEDEEESFVWREAYIKTYLEMDIPQLAIRIPSIQLRRFWTMLAHSHGQLWNASKIAGSLGLSAPTVRRYLDILEETFIVRQLEPYFVNAKKRLIKSPKVYIRDSGLNHALLRIRTMDELMGHPSAGASWEGFVIEQIAALLPRNTNLYFYRTSAGAEIDLLCFDKGNEPLPIEIKYSLSPSVSRGFWSAYDDLSCKRGFVVYPGKEKYPLGKNVFALPLAMLESLWEI
jgi:predicted AAA+ superfamily ATPase